MARSTRLTVLLTILLAVCVGCELGTRTTTEPVVTRAAPTRVAPAEIEETPAAERTVGIEATKAPAEPVAIEVHLWQTYEDDEVRISIDGQVVFSDRVTTDDVLSLAARIPITVSSGSHRIGVLINRSVEEETTFHTKDVAVIAVTYIPAEDAVAFELLDFRPAYR